MYVTIEIFITYIIINLLAIIFMLWKILGRVSPRELRSEIEFSLIHYDTHTVKTYVEKKFSDLETYLDIVYKNETVNPGRYEPKAKV